MSALQQAEEAVDQLAQEEFEEFLRWLSNRLSQRLGSAAPSRLPSAQELAEHQAEQIRTGAKKPFDGADLSRWPEAARKKAEELIANWEAVHG